VREILEQLRVVKLFRTPPALRCFGRIFTVLLPPCYAPVYAQVARETNSLTIGIAFGIITALALTALFESMEVLEDPFTAFLALDGIDAREEFEVLHFSQLTTTRQLVFPEAPMYPAARRAALTRSNHPGKKLHTIGMPPTQPFHAASSPGFPIKTPTIDSGITIEEGITDHPVPGDGTIATNESPVFVDTGHADIELGMDLSLTGINYEPNRQERVSVFDEDRAALGVDESTHLRHRRTASHFDGPANANNEALPSPGAPNSLSLIHISEPTRPY